MRTKQLGRQSRCGSGQKDTKVVDLLDFRVLGDDAARMRQNIVRKAPALWLAAGGADTEAICP